MAISADSKKAIERHHVIVFDTGIEMGFPMFLKWENIKEFSSNGVLRIEAYISVLDA